VVRWIYAEISKTALTLPVFYDILSNMKTKERQNVRPRSEIIGKIAAIPSAVQGKICEMHKKLAGGKTATYYNLQYWSEGRNHSIHVPREKLAEFKEAVAGGKRLRSLVTELGEADASDILSSASPLKKKSSRSPSGARPARRH
jgi:hypothetical protein